MPYSIMLDAGHGGRDPGAVYNGRQEKDDALALTLAVGEIVQDRGIEVLYTRTTDVYESPYQKAMEANAAGVDFFISIHRNSSPEANTYSGVESLVYNKSGTTGSCRLCQSGCKRAARSRCPQTHAHAGCSRGARLHQFRNRQPAL